VRTTPRESNDVLKPNNVTGSQDRTVWSVLGHEVRIECDDAVARGALAPIFAAFGEPPTADSTDSLRVLHYSIKSAAERGYWLQCPGSDWVPAADLGELVFQVEHSLVVELQRGNATLLFLHAAVLEWDGRACLLVAESGGGKSTTTWALLHHGFRYLSDELAPIDVEAMQVFAYPHALCLKRAPPAPFALPAATMQLGRTMHVPTAQMPLAFQWRSPRPLAAIFHITYAPDNSAPNITRMGAAEAAARLYVNALNALAHPACGVDAVARIAERAPNFAVVTAELSMTCAMLLEAIRGLNESQETS
jgi:hypothetical protein